MDVLVTGRVDVLEGPRRPGDMVGACTRSEKTVRLLGWRAEHDLTDGIADALARSERRPRPMRDLAAVHADA